MRLTRREALLGGVAAACGLLLPGCGRELPPTYGHILRMGDPLPSRLRARRRAHTLVRRKGGVP
jgi:hypothetical protein